jgi:hypothetical protein
MIEWPLVGRLIARLAVRQIWQPLDAARNEALPPPFTPEGP